MTDSRQRNAGHFTRSRDPKPVAQKILKIVTDKKKLPLEEGTGSEQEILQNYHKFNKLQIDVPDAINNTNKPSSESGKPADKMDVDQDNSKLSSTTETSEAAGKSTPVVVEKKLEKPKPKGPTVSVPDYFANVKIKNPDQFLKYRRIIKDNSNDIIPAHYIHYVQEANEEVQNTEEKFWTFSKKMYEVTEQAISELKEHKINISPSDYEWVIDCFEKTTINKEQISKVHAINSLRSRVPSEVSERLNDSNITKIWELWKPKREDRKNRPFIREFWYLQEDNSTDNYAVFKSQDPGRMRPAVREKMRNKKLVYIGAFQERDSALTLCDELQLLYDNFQLQMSQNSIEELMFDRIIGATPALNEGAGPVPHTDQSLKEMGYSQVPTLPIEEQTRLDSKSLREFMEVSEEYKREQLQPVISFRQYHKSLRPPEPKPQPRPPVPKQHPPRPTPQIVSEPAIVRAPPQPHMQPQIHKDIIPIEPQTTPKPPIVQKPEGTPKPDSSPSLEDLLSWARNLINKKRKEKSSQKVNFSTIKLISMILHFQKQDLCLKLTGDQEQRYHSRQGQSGVQVFRVMEQFERGHVEKFYHSFTIQQETPRELDDFEKLHEDRVKKNDNEEKKQSTPSLEAKVFDKEKQLQKYNEEFDQLKQRKFKIRRGRNSRIFYKSMAKTVFDYDTTLDDLLTPSTRTPAQQETKESAVGKKRTYKETLPENAKGIDMDMENMHTFISDIEEHCQSKRLKKNIYKFDCIKLGGLQSTSGKGYLPSALAQINYKPSEPIWNPGVTQASSDSVKFPRGQNDPVIDKKFKSENAKIYNEIMKTDFNQQLQAKSMNPEQLFESSNYQDLTEFFDSRKTTTSSSKFGYPYEKEEKQVDPREQVSGRIKKLQDVVFSKANNGKAVEDYKSKVAQDFSKYKQWVNQQQNQRSQKQAQRSQQNTFRP